MWMIKEPVSGLIYVLIISNIMCLYGWNKSVNFGSKMVSSYENSQYDLKNCRNTSFKEIQKISQIELNNRDSIIYVLEEKISQIEKQVPKR